MDRTTRRIRRVRLRSRHTKLVAGVAVAAASVVVLAAAAFGQQGQASVDKPPPKGDKVDLKPLDQPPVAAGGGGQGGAQAQPPAVPKEAGTPAPVTCRDPGQGRGGAR